MLYTYEFIWICIYIYIHTHTHTHIYIYILCYNPILLSELLFSCGPFDTGNFLTYIRMKYMKSMLNLHTHTQSHTYTIDKYRQRCNKQSWPWHSSCCTTPFAEKLWKRSVPLRTRRCEVPRRRLVTGGMFSTVQWSDTSLVIDCAADDFHGYPLVNVYRTLENHHF